MLVKQVASLLHSDNKNNTVLSNILHDPPPTFIFRILVKCRIKNQGMA